MAEKYTWKNFSEEEKEARKKLFGPGSSCLDGVISEPYGLIAPHAMEKVVEKCMKLEVRPDDIWIVTYPKCGTTMTQVSYFLLIISEDVYEI